ncbi:MAG: heme exporter, ATP-binding protein CcmA [Dehalococcoidia bacterium]|nr:heme exporter, ATP-binding protein CcmA [Dehalococcoidia bacterium]
MPVWAIESEGVFKSFGLKPALQGIDLKVKIGEFLTVFGPNGAGKTTLIKVLSSLSKPDSGRVLINGLDAGRHAAEARRSIGLVSHQTFLYDNLTAYENLRFYGRMFDVPNPDKRIREVIAKVGLTSRLHDRVRTFSRGLQQRLSIARAILHQPPILLLDEPETGLDQMALTLLKETVHPDSSGTDERRTVLMATHNLERGLAMGDRAIVLVEGKVAYEQSTQALDLAHFCATYLQLAGVRE